MRFRWLDTLASHPFAFRQARRCGRRLRPQVEQLEDRTVPALFPADFALASLDGGNGFHLDGLGDVDRSGSSVKSAGDVNGDGFGDVIIGAPNAEGGGSSRGQSYVVFGQSSGFAAGLNVGALNGTNGFRINGIADNDQSGFSVSGAGDVNGDGFDDLIIGTQYGNGGGISRGESYVVFGSSAFAPDLNLSALDGSNGFRINGIADSDLSGQSVSGASDVNGDGFDDVIIGAHDASGGGNDFGESYVVFGHSGAFAASLNLSDLNGSNGFRINGIADNDFSGRSVSGAGDVNGDGFDDLIIGAPYADGGGSDRGESYVVFGHSGAFAVDLNLSDLNGSNGFRINGIADNDFSGRSVSGAGDVNGDGFDDLIVGAPYAETFVTDLGQSYVVFGHSGAFASVLNLSALNGSNGFRINGRDQAGRSVSEAGDVNGDGFDDLIVGIPFSDGGGSSRGQSCVVFGHSGAFAADLDVSALNGSNGFRINGSADDDRSGGSVSAAGDVNGDGIDDLILGAPDADPGGDLSGQSYVIFGCTNLIATGPDSGSGPQVQVFRSDGTFRFTLFPYGDTFTGGVRVAVADINRDGQPDIITAPGGGMYARIRAFDGRFGLPLPIGFSNGLVAYSPNYLKGASIAAGDVDGDGRSEIVVSPDKGPNRPVKIFNHDGTLLDSFLPYGSVFKGGVRIAVGNTEGTAAAEIITVKSSGSPTLRVFDGTGTQLQQFTVTGNFVAVGDVTGDSQADILVGSNVGQNGRVRIYNGLTGALQSTQTPYESSFTGGVRVSTVDFGGELAVLTGPGKGRAGDVRLFDGVSGTLLDSFFAYDPDFSGGLFVAGG